MKVLLLLCLSSTIAGQCSFEDSTWTSNDITFGTIVTAPQDIAFSFSSSETQGSATFGYWSPSCYNTWCYLAYPGSWLPGDSFGTTVRIAPTTVTISNLDCCTTEAGISFGSIGLFDIVWEEGCDVLTAEVCTWLTETSPSQCSSSDLYWIRTPSPPPSPSAPPPPPWDSDSDDGHHGLSINDIIGKRRCSE
jgi:hypothetical protein